MSAPDSVLTSRNATLQDMVALLRYLADSALRARVTAATNKAEVYHGFSAWLRFGNHGVIAENDPAEQEKSVTFTSLLANLVVFHTPVDMMAVIRELIAEAGGGPGPALAVPGGPHPPVRRLRHRRAAHPAGCVRPGVGRRRVRHRAGRRLIQHGERGPPGRPRRSSVCRG